MAESLLDCTLLTLPLSDSAKAALAAEIFDQNACHQSLHTTGLELDAYWNFYTRECARALHNGGRHVALRTHGDIVACIQKLKSGVLRGEAKDHVRSNLTATHANEVEMLDNSINLAATILLMTSFCSYSYGFSGRGQLCWNETESLRDFVAGYFRPTQTQKDTGIKLEKIFTARNLGRIAGLEIIWTDNLVDHLRLTDDDTRVHIFHHASFLETQKQSQSSLLPDGLAEETLQTLALLWPSGDPDTRKWMNKLASSVEGIGIDRRIIQCGRLSTNHRQIDRFQFWGDRIMTLKQVFDESQPRTLSRWWYDRRNGVQWYTFWVAVLVLVLTVFFGLVQSIEGAMQVYASFRSLEEPDGGGMH